MITAAYYPHLIWSQKYVQKYLYTVLNWLIDHAHVRFTTTSGFTLTGQFQYFTG